jgi:hypothetical protein
MSETISLLFATTLLALGGAGLYLYKSSEENNEDENVNEYEYEYEYKDKDNDDNYKENNLFNSNDENYILEETYKSKNNLKQKINKTKRNKKAYGTKRRY